MKYLFAENEVIVRMSLPFQVELGFPRDQIFALRAGWSPDDAVELAYKEAGLHVRDFGLLMGWLEYEIPRQCFTCKPNGERCKNPCRLPVDVSDFDGAGCFCEFHSDSGETVDDSGETVEVPGEDDSGETVEVPGEVQ